MWGYLNASQRMRTGSTHRQLTIEIDVFCDGDTDHVRYEVNPTNGDTIQTPSQDICTQTLDNFYSPIQCDSVAQRVVPDTVGLCLAKIGCQFL